MKLEAEFRLLEVELMYPTLVAELDLSAAVSCRLAVAE